MYTLMYAPVCYRKISYSPQSPTAPVIYQPKSQIFPNDWSNYENIANQDLCSCKKIGMNKPIAIKVNQADEKGNQSVSVILRYH